MQDARFICTLDHLVSECAGIEIIFTLWKGSNTSARELLTYLWT